MFDLQTSDSGSCAAGAEDSGSVRFDNNVSYISPHSYEGCDEVKDSSRNRWGWGGDRKPQSSDSDSVDASVRPEKCSTGAGGETLAARHAPESEATGNEASAKANASTSNAANGTPKRSAVATLRSVFFHSARATGETARPVGDAELPNALPVVAEPAAACSAGDIDVVIDVPDVTN